MGNKMLKTGRIGYNYDEKKNKELPGHEFTTFELDVLIDELTKARKMMKKNLNQMIIKLDHCINASMN